jgi:predicted NBD/HSP70 family sugar kinase
MVPRWAGVNVVRTFGDALGTTVLADNESNCSAIAEQMWGAAQGEEDFILFKADVGVGGAIVIGGRVVRGIGGGAGEFGHISIDPEGELCRCGNRGCLELKLGFEGALDRLSAIAGRRVSMEEAVAMALSGDVGAARLVTDHGDLAGQALALIGNVLNPPLFLVSGTLARAGDMVLAPLIASFEKFSLLKPQELAPQSRTRIVLGKLLANDVVLGAVGLVLRHHGRMA